MSEQGWDELCRCRRRCGGTLTFPDHELPAEGFIVLEVVCDDCGCAYRCDRNHLGTKVVYRDAERSYENDSRCIS